MFLKKFEEGQWNFDTFRLIPGSERLQLIEDASQELLSLPLLEARVALRRSTCEIIEFNPVAGVPSGLQIWSFRNGRVRDLTFDPMEWSWPKDAMLQPTNFFGYSRKRGYRIILKKQHRQLGFNRWLESSGYNFAQRRDFFARLWHNWIPRKISSIQIWLTIADGLPIGAWRNRCFGHPGLCTLFNLQVLQTSDHALFSCAAVSEAWTKLRLINTLAGRPPGPTNWEEALYGDLGRPLPSGGGSSTGEDHQWEASKACRISKDTPFYILQYCLLWYIWCQHTDYDLHSRVFHIGVALYRVWQTTVQVDKAAWTELQRFRKKRSPEKQGMMESLFMDIWAQGYLFCSNSRGAPQWKPTPPPQFLFQDLADKFSSTRISSGGTTSGLHAGTKPWIPFAVDRRVTGAGDTKYTSSHA